MCGLFGFVSSGDNKFNWDKFNYLGVDNDPRGGDSIGRLINDKIEKWINPKIGKTTYKDYVIMKANADVENVKTAMGHVRKASVGGASIAVAQPIIVPVDLEDGSIGQFAMVHNGTLSNYEELAKKYNVDIDGKSDSIVLAEIIRDYGWDVLGEYQGGTTIIIKDDREPGSLFVFKGESKKYDTVGSICTEERPLYVYALDKETMYFSSLEDGLMFIGGDVDSISDIPTNVVLQFTGSEVLTVKEISRANVGQFKIFTRQVATSTQAEVDRYYDNSFEDDYGYGRYGSHLQNQSSVANNYNKKTTEAVTTIKDAEYNVYGVRERDDDLVSNINEEKSEENSSLAFSWLKYAKGRYWHRNKICNGPVRVNIFGLVNSGAKADNEFRVLYFYNGILLINKECYDVAKKELGPGGKLKETMESTKTLASLSVYPVTCFANTASLAYVGHINHRRDAFLADSIIRPIFSQKTYAYSGGFVTLISDADLSKQAEFNKKEKDDEELLKGIFAFDSKAAKSKEMLEDRIKSNLRSLGSIEKEEPTDDDSVEATEEELRGSTAVIVCNENDDILLNDIDVQMKKSDDKVAEYEASIDAIEKQEVADMAEEAAVQVKDLISKILSEIDIAGLNYQETLSENLRELSMALTDSELLFTKTLKIDYEE